MDTKQVTLPKVVFVHKLMNAEPTRIGRSMILSSTIIVMQANWKKYRTETTSNHYAKMLSNTEIEYSPGFLEMQMTHAEEVLRDSMERIINA